MPSGYVKLTGGDVLATKSYLLVKIFYTQIYSARKLMDSQKLILQLYLYQIF